MFFGSTAARPASISGAVPALALEADDVGLEEDGAAVAELRHALGLEGVGRVVANIDAEGARGGFEEIAVARRALRVQHEVLDAAILQRNQLDVLAADIDDDIDVRAELLRRAGVGHGLDQCDVGAQDALEHVLRIARGCRTQYSSLAPSRSTC